MRCVQWDWKVRLAATGAVGPEGPTTLRFLNHFSYPASREERAGAAPATGLGLEDPG